MAKTYYTTRLYFILISTLICCIYKKDTFAITTIAGGYTNRPDTCVFLTPNPSPTFPLITTHWGEILSDGNPSDSVIVQIRPTYRFDGPFGAGAVYPPDRVTIPWPYCGSSGYFYSPLTLQPDWPTPTTAGCEGLLLYGYEDIPIIGQDNSIGFNNSIIGKRVHRIDPGYPAQYKGTVTYFRPDNASCPSPNLTTFRILLNTTGLNNIDDVTPIAYTDSASLETKYCPVYGLACDVVPRPVNSIRYDPRITVNPVCKQIMPFDNAFTLSDYQEVYGIDAKGPFNVNQSAIVYQIKVDNLPAPLAVQVKLRFDYVQGTTPSDTTIGPFYVNQATIYYVASIGTHPALVRVQYYNNDQPFTVIWNEVNLSYLDRCYCSTNNASVPNLVCDSNTQPNMISPVLRTDIPNYNALPDNYVDAVTCVFYVNNGSDVYKGITFPVESYAVTDSVGTIVFLWEIGGTPPENVDIATPLLANTDITINTVGLVTVNLTVSLLGFNPPRIRKCSQNLQVFNGAPTAYLDPLEATIPLATFLVLNGSLSTTPAPFAPLSWTWSITLEPSVGGGTLSTTTGPTTQFSATVTGIYIVSMTVCNILACNSEFSAVINAGQTPSPLVPPVDCFNSSNPPFNYTVPTTPAPSPIAPSPNTPITPAPIGHGGIFGPIAAIPASVIETATAIIVIIAVLVVLFGIILMVKRSLDDKEERSEKEKKKL